MRYKLIIADDYDFMRELLRAIISSMPESIFDVVYEAKNGIELLDAVRKYNPNLIITDIRMPYMDGIEAAKRIKEIDENIKIIFFSAYNYEKDRDVLEIAYDYINKPFEIERLIESIRGAAEDNFSTCNIF